MFVRVLNTSLGSVWMDDLKKTLVNHMGSTPTNFPIMKLKSILCFCQHYYFTRHFCMSWRYCITHLPTIWRTISPLTQYKTNEEVFLSFPQYSLHKKWIFPLSISSVTLRNKCSYLELFWFVLSCIRTEYGEILRIYGLFTQCKCDQIRRKLRIWSHLLNKSLMENFIFCEVTLTQVFIYKF